MNTPRCFAFAVSLVSLVSLGCAAETTSTASANEPAEAGPAACSALVNVAEAVPLVAEPADPPPALGGALVDGTFVVSKAVLYTGAGGASGPTGQEVKMTAAVRGKDLESIFDGVGRRAVVRSIEGATLHTAGVCPSQEVDEVSFSATPAGFSLYLKERKGTRVYSFSKI